jgi:hypothetical protein
MVEYYPEDYGSLGEVAELIEAGYLTVQWALYGARRWREETEAARAEAAAVHEWDRTHCIVCGAPFAACVC